MAAHDTSHSPDRELEPKPDPSPPWTFTPPRTDFQVRDWLRFVAGTIAADPARYMHSPEQAARFIALADRYDDSLGVVISPDTRTILATKQKDAAREEARKAILAAMHFIKAHPGIDAQAKFALGMKPAPRKGKRPVEPPDTVPVLGILEAGPDATHTFDFADEETPMKRKRPRGAGYLEVRILLVPPAPAPAPGTPAPGTVSHVPIWLNPEASAEELAAVGAVVRTERITRTPFTIQHDPAHAGWFATYHGRWMTNTNKPGRWGVPVCMTIAYAFTPGRPPGSPEI